jgi:hypothetical protein
MLDKAGGEPARAWLATTKKSAGKNLMSDK